MGTKCMEVCLEAQRTCTETMVWCLRTGGRYADAHLIRALLDCSQIAQTTTDFLARGSPFYETVCAACVTVATLCAQECERYDDEPSLMRCAAACRRCAECCSEVGATR